MPWLKAEFGWQERSARNFINVANRFESATIADLEIDLSAAYLLASPSVPERARTNAIERATKGERIRRSVARELIADSRCDKPVSNGAAPTRERAVATLQKLKANWPPETLSDFALLLREFADSVDPS